MRELISLKEKRAMEFGFSWIFAIIAGAVILFLAIYGASQIINISKSTQYGEAAKSLSILYEPLQGVADAQLQVIKFNKETRIVSDCYTPDVSNFFGRQTIAVTEKSGFGQKWAKAGPEISIYNKFIFADRQEQGKEMYVFSKPLYLGFKVSDLIMSVSLSEDYCFVSAPNFVLDEIQALGFRNINFTNNLLICEQDSEKICFGFNSPGCESGVFGDVDFTKGTIIKQGKTVAYAGNLLYAGIFSSPEIYECNVNRLSKKSLALAYVYDKKVDLVKSKDCNSLIANYLKVMGFGLANLERSSDLIPIYNVALQMDEQNKKAECQIYAGEDY